MDQFVLANPGLRSRFAKTIAFKDYTAGENAEIFEVFCAENDYTLDPDGHLKLLAYLKSLKGLELERFANAGVCANYSKNRSAIRPTGYCVRKSQAKTI